MRKIIKFIGLTSTFVMLLIATIGSVEAVGGTWTSSSQLDLNGVSTVYTTYITGGNASETIKLEVKTSSGSIVGGKTVGCRKDQFVEHTAWGQPMLSKYGRVGAGSGVHHNPGFDV